MGDTYFHSQTLIKKIFAFCAMILVAFYIYFGFQAFDAVKVWNAFYQSDFYINYEGGFVRRRLEGQIIYELSRMMSVNVLYNLITQKPIF